MKKLLIILTSISTLFAFAQEKKPNIILFLSDDQSTWSVGGYGYEQAKTPNIDKLMDNGAIVFSNNYAVTSICMGNRASIMTGMFEYKTGCNFLRSDLKVDKFNKSYPILLRNAGYYTGFAGKLGFVLDEINENAKTKAYKNLPVDKFDWWAGGPGQTFYKTESNEYIKQYAKDYPHSTRAYGAACSDFIKNAVKSDKPFMLSMSFKAPHNPQTPDPFFDDVFADVIWEKFDTYGRDYANHLAPQSRLGRQYLSLFNGYGFRNNFQDRMTKYYQLVYGVDYAIGMILAEVKKQGIADNTVIIFTGDNGYFRGEHGFGGKVLPYECGSQTPLVIFDPRKGYSGKNFTEALTGSIDLAPTILELAGVEIPENMDGVSLLKIIDNPKASVRESMPLIQAWGSAPTFAFTVLSGDFKYIYWPYADGMPPAEELFNFKEDPSEFKNLVADKDHKIVLEKMRKLYDKQVEQWKADAVDYANYKVFGTIFDRNIPWEDKKDLIPQVYMDCFRKELKTIGYKGDIKDWKAILARLDQKDALEDSKSKERK